MDIGIVGAGIAGLGASIALLRAGHTVTIYEKSSFKNEIGAAILVTPNGNLVLRRWGFDFGRAKPVDFKVFRFVNAATLDVAVDDNLETVEADYGERICAYHRVDLHRGLRECAEKHGVSIELSSEVTSVDAENGSFSLKDGNLVKKDLVILADGCHTKFLGQVTGEDTPTVKIGKSVYRWLAPFDKVLQHPQARELWDKARGPGFCTFFFPGKPVMIVTYPCRNQELLNCAVFHDTRPEETNKLDWDSNTTHEKVLDAMEGCCDAVLNIPKTAEEVKVYTVTQRPPSPRIQNGRMLAIGDTTHHMLPTHAQGGCQALEDAAALEVLFQSSSFSSLPPTQEELHSRLELYQQLRMPRSATTQILSSTNPNMTMAGLNHKTEEIRQFYQGDLVNWPLGVHSWSAPIRDFFYGYDIWEQAEKAMKFKGDGKVEDGTLKWFGDVDHNVKMSYAGRV